MEQGKSVLDRKNGKYRTHFWVPDRQSIALNSIHNIVYDLKMPAIKTELKA